jgi:hypothetical protein
VDLEVEVDLEEVVLAAEGWDREVLGEDLAEAPVDGVDRLCRVVGETPPALATPALATPALATTCHDAPLQ